MNYIPFVICTLINVFLSTSEALPRNISGRSPTVVGGVEAIKGEFPWIVGIRRPYHGCAASIINSEWVISAAHCTQGLITTYELVAGDHKNDEVEASEQRRNATRIVNHPNYKSMSNDFDISLIQVSPPFEFNEFVQPIALAPSGFIPTEIETVAGWGRLSYGGITPTVLMKVDVPYVSDEDCRASYGDVRIKDAMLCAGRGGKDACQGDSGGPLMCPVGDDQILCGIVSFGDGGCATPEFPGVYTEVSYYVDEFISHVLNN